MENNPLLKRLIKIKTEEALHSSAYGLAQNRQIGTASTETFGHRMRVDRNRKLVKRYGESRIVNDALSNAPRPKTYQPPENQAPLPSSKMTPPPSGK